MAAAIEVSLAWRELSQSHQVLGALKGADPANVVVLDMSHNELADLSFLASFPAVITVVCDHNSVTDLGINSIPLLSRAETLSLNANQLTNLTKCINSIQRACPKLLHLSLLGNACCPNYLTQNGSPKAYADYRKFVAAKLPGLRTLDGVRVTEKEVSEGKKLYGGKKARSADASGKKSVVIKKEAPKKKSAKQEQAKIIEDDDEYWTSGDEL